MQLTPDNIEFDGNQERFKPGEIVRGTVSLNAPRDYHVTAIICRFKGEARTRWNGMPRAGYWHYFDKEKYLFYALSQQTHMAAGSHRFNFTYRLPDNIPPSFWSRFGDIKYLVELSVVRPGKITIRTQKMIKVIGGLDEFDWRDLQNRRSQIYSLRVNGSLFGNLGRIHYKSSLDHSYLIPGTEVNVESFIENQSSRTVEKVKVELWRKVQYFTSARFCHTTDVSKVLQISSHRLTIQPGMNRHVSHQLTLPDTIYSSFNSEIMTVSYFLCVIISTNGLLTPNVDFNMTIDIIDEAYTPTTVPQVSAPLEFPTVENPRNIGQILNVAPTTLWAPRCRNNRRVLQIYNPVFNAYEETEEPPTYAEIEDMEDPPPRYAEVNQARER
ncbi:hypothetical protein GCK72_004803 [Caenorhabditis remanei]|uniref:Arrestin C-terminal-like domain-containing protein n=1 Tax=Caenorhabditis remanei TaxID=31234 RepID=A0A6A5HES9_CAERE|nr:hypothetical protein GCK72_004803 [Caenorhabditis remanei]KAF1764853.1 hypothetical protein GCK72_004803 [Caenorhabditis remanei]